MVKDPSSPYLRPITEKVAPIIGPNKKPREKAIPIKACKTKTKKKEVIISAVDLAIYVDKKCNKDEDLQCSYYLHVQMSRVME